jgi:hypothetical protein
MAVEGHAFRLEEVSGISPASGLKSDQPNLKRNFVLG